MTEDAQKEAAQEQDAAEPTPADEKGDQPPPPEQAKSGIAEVTFPGLSEDVCPKDVQKCLARMHVKMKLPFPVGPTERGVGAGIRHWRKPGLPNEK